MLTDRPFKLGSPSLAGCIVAIELHVKCSTPWCHRKSSVPGCSHCRRGRSLAYSITFAEPLRQLLRRKTMQDTFIASTFSDNFPVYAVNFDVKINHSYFLLFSCSCWMRKWIFYVRCWRMFLWGNWKHFSACIT